jgi:hypothetical protein
MNKLKQIDDNLPHHEEAQVREERRRIKRSLTLGYRTVRLSDARL